MVVDIRKPVQYKSKLEDAIEVWYERIMINPVGDRQYDSLGRFISFTQRHRKKLSFLNKHYIIACKYHKEHYNRYR